MTRTFPQPLEDRVLVRRDDGEKETPGGILLPDNAQKKSRKGTVLAVGPGRYPANPTAFPTNPSVGWPEYLKIPVNLSIGETIYFTSYAGEEIEHDGEKLIIMREADILAVEQ